MFKLRDNFFITMIKKKSGKFESEKYKKKNKQKIKNNLRKYVSVSTKKDCYGK